MAYFKSNEQEPENTYPEADVNETDYDDGFDDLYEAGEEVPELSREENACKFANAVKSGKNQK